MNCQLTYVLLFAAFCGSLVSAETSVPRANVSLSSSADQMQHGHSFELTCNYDLHFPDSPQEQSKESNWEITVSFHKETMTMNPSERHRTIAEYRQDNSTDQMSFHTVAFEDGLNVWPADGKMKTGKQSPKRVTVVPGEMSMTSSGMLKCSVTMHLKGTDAKVRYFGKTNMNQGPSM